MIELTGEKISVHQHGRFIELFSLSPIDGGKKRICKVAGERRSDEGISNRT